MSQYTQLPAPSVSLLSIGANGASAPGSSDLVGGKDGSGNLQPLSVTSGGVLNVNISTQSLDVTVDLVKVGGAAIALGQGAMAASLPVAIASNQSAIPVSQSGTWNINNISGTISLPTGAATESTLSTLNGKIPSGLTVSSTRLLVDGSGATQPVSGTVTVQQSTAASLNATVVGTGTFAVQSTLQAGSAIAGKFGIDQTTPGTTNAVAVAQIGSTSVATGNGVVGTGVQRVAIASDNTAFSVNATLQAGSAIAGKFGIDQTTIGTTNGVTVVPSSSSTAANSSVASSALEASKVIKASAGRLYQLSGVNTKSSAQYIQVFNSTTVPSDSTAPVLLAYVPAGGNFSFDFGSIGRYFSTGIAVSNSSTAATKTIGSADCWFNAEYS